MEEFDYSKIGNKQSNMRRQFRKGFTYFLVVAACIAFYFLLLRAGSIAAWFKKIVGLLSPIWFGCAFAFLLNPLMKFFEGQTIRILDKKRDRKDKNRKIGRIVGVIISMLLAIAAIALLFNMIIPRLYETIRQLIIVLPSELNQLVNRINNISTESNLGQYLQVAVEKINDMFQQWLRGDLWGGVNQLMSVITNGLIDVLSTVIHILIGFIVAVYILLGKEKFCGQGKKILYAVLPREKGNFVLHILRKANEIFGGFLTGKIIDSIIIGVLCFIGMTIFRISDQYALLVSVIVGVTNVIPVFGPYFGAIPSALLILLENPLHGLYFIIFIILLQQLDGNVIGPKILGNSTGLSAFWVMFAILLFGGLFGFIGMLIGVPAFAVIYYVIKMIINDKLRRKKLPNESELYTDISGIDDHGELLVPPAKKKNRGETWKNIFLRNKKKDKEPEEAKAPEAEKETEKSGGDQQPGQSEEEKE